MYTYEERCIMNLGDCYTLMYGYVVQQLLETFGEKGEKAAREGTRQFGIDRATATRNKHLAVGAKINMENLFTLYHDLPGDPRFRRELQELNTQERVSHTLVGPMADVWKEHGQMHIGRIYCEEFHSACYSAYAYGYTHVNLAKTLTQEGDDYCAFNIVLRPQNLPKELRPVCFEEYDPLYTKPNFPHEKISGKNGFGMLSVKLWFHLLYAVVDQLGEEGGKAAEAGLRNFARAVAEILKKSAAESGRKIDGTFLSNNLPVDMETDVSFWKDYAAHRARERMIENFCGALLMELTT